MSNIIKIVADVTTANIGDPIFLGRTPHGGGAGRECKYQVLAPTLTAVVEIQGHNGHGEGGAFGEIDPPAEDDSGWFTVLTFGAGEPALEDRSGEIADLPRWIRYETTTLDADGPDVVVVLEGVQ